MMKRRHLVMGGAAVLVTPEKWTSPIVKSVVLPVHASSTTPMTDGDPLLPPPPVNVGGGGAVCIALCDAGVDDASSQTPIITNTSEDPLTVTGVSFSNANHYTNASFPAQIPGIQVEPICNFTIRVRDSSETCPDPVSPGSITIQFAGFQDLVIPIP